MARSMKPFGGSAADVYLISHSFKREIMIRNFWVRLTAVAVSTVVVASLGKAQTVLPPAATLIAKYSEAVGAPALLAAKAIVTKGGMSMPAAGINATFELTQLSPNQMAMVTEIPGLGTVQAGFDGTTAWSMDPMQGARVLSGKELDQIKDEADRRGIARSPEIFSAVQTIADTTMNSERCYLVKLTWKSGRQTHDCYSAASGLLVASTSIQPTAMGEIPVVTLFSDYKKFGEVMVPTKTVQEMMGTQQILTIASVTFGDGAGVTITPPAAIQALAKPPAK
jgi:zinc protease